MAKKSHRAYENKYPSVTTILGVLRKVALEYWFKVNTMKFITEESSKGKQIGTDIHNAIEHFIITGEAKIETEYPDEVTNALKSFMLFRKVNPQYVLNWSEMALTSEKYKFNGTIDCIGFEGEERIILDWKTATCKEKEIPEIYDEYKYQVSAYVHLYNEIQNANVEKAIIVSIAKDKIAYNTYIMDKKEIEDCFNEVFLNCLRILNYQKRRKECLIQTT